MENIDGMRHWWSPLFSLFVSEKFGEGANNSHKQICKFEWENLGDLPTIFQIH